MQAVSSFLNSPLLSVMNPFSNASSPYLVKIYDKHEAFNNNTYLPKILIPPIKEPEYNLLQFNIDMDNERNPFHNVITYMDHPNIKHSDKPITKSSSKCKDDCNKMDTLTQFYIGSITVVGLFLVFRIMQKSK